MSGVSMDMSTPTADTATRTHTGRPAGTDTPTPAVHTRGDIVRTGADVSGQADRTPAVAVRVLSADRGEGRT